MTRQHRERRESRPLPSRLDEGSGTTATTRQRATRSPAQREACKRKAESLGATIVEQFVDAARAPETTDRMELQRLLAYVKENPVDYVIVHKVDRWARPGRR